MPCILYVYSVIYYYLQRFILKIMENKLISMVEFVQWIKFEPPKTDENHSNHFGYKFGMVCKYANFLNTPLNLGMFVPAIEVDGKWEVLEEPESLKGFYETDKEGMIQERKDLDKYQKAKDNVIFEGWTLANETQSAWSVYDSDNRLVFIKEDGECLDGKTIQDLIKYKPTLTKKGLEVSGLNR